MYVVDLWRKQADASESVEAMLDLAEKWKPLIG